MASTVISGSGYPFGAFIQDPSTSQWIPWPVDSNKVPQVSLMAADLSSVVTMQNAASATGTGTVLPTAGMGVATIAISGTFNATIMFEGKGPDNNWYQINAKQRGVGTIGTTTTSPGLYELNARGLSAIRANITSYTSGTITVVGWAQPLEASPEMVNATLTGSIPTLDSTTTPLGANGTYTSAQWFDVSKYKSIVGSVFADQAGTLVIQQSFDSINPDVQSTISVSASSGQGFEIAVVAPKARLSYTNGSTPQGTFRLYAGGKSV